MKLTKEEALEYHRQMLGDMQRELCDRPNAVKRMRFKREWCKKHFPDEHISANCFLCEYARGCDQCPIKWDVEYDNANCEGFVVNYLYSPISVILALPEREVEDEISDN